LKQRGIKSNRQLNLTGFKNLTGLKQQAAKMKTIAFFNSKSGIGKTTLVYHLAWMYAELGLNVVVADLDPQAHLTSMFLEEDRLEELWPDGDHPESILGTISPILKGHGDILEPHLERITEKISLIVGDLELFLFEKPLSEAMNCNDANELTFLTLSAFYRTLLAASQQADVVLIDISPSLSAINMAALIATEYLVIPLKPNQFYRFELNNIRWCLHHLKEKWPFTHKKSMVNINLPTAHKQTVGYVILQSHPRETRWMDIPHVFRQTILNENIENPPTVAQDSYCLATYPYYWSLIQMATEARKPMFHLKPADGAMGASALAVKDCYKEFKQLALNLANACTIPMVNND